VGYSEAPTLGWTGFATPSVTFLSKPKRKEAGCKPAPATLAGAWNPIFLRVSLAQVHSFVLGKNTMNIATTFPNPMINMPSLSTAINPINSINPISKWRLRYLGLIATGLVIMGILCNVIFYSEFGQGLSSVVYASIGLLLDLTKIAIIGLFVMFVADFEKNLIETTICVITWFVLSLLSFGAAYGFLSQVNERYEVERLRAASTIYAQHENAVKTAQQKLDGLSQYASLNPQSLESQRATLALSLVQWENKKNKCPDNWYTKCINPAQAQIDRIQAEQLSVKNQLENYAAYQAAAQYHQTAVKAFSQLDGSNAVQYHPLFVNVGDMTNSEPRSVKSLFILLTSFVTELLASILFFLKARLVNAAYVYTQPSTSPRIVSTGADLQSVQPVQPPQLSAQNTALVPAAVPQTTQTVPANPTVPTPLTPNPAASDIANTAVYQQIVAEVRSKALTSASFRTLKSKYQLNQNQAAEVRNQLVADGLAVMNRRELIFV